MIRDSQLLNPRQSTNLIIKSSELACFQWKMKKIIALNRKGKRSISHMIENKL